MFLRAISMQFEHPGTSQPACISVDGFDARWEAVFDMMGLAPCLPPTDVSQTYPAAAMAQPNSLLLHRIRLAAARGELRGEAPLRALPPLPGAPGAAPLHQEGWGNENGAGLLGGQELLDVTDRTDEKAAIVAAAAAEMRALAQRTEVLCEPRPHHAALPRLPSKL
jgi:hypothetical protein